MASGSAAARLRRALLAGALSEQLRFGNDGNPRAGEIQSLQPGSHGQGEFDIAVGEGIPTWNARQGVPVTAQHLLEDFAPSRRVGRDQHPPGELVRNRSSGAKGCSARASIRSSYGAVVGKLRDPGPTRQSVSALKVLRVIEANCDRRASMSCGLMKSSAGAQHGPLDVVPAILIAHFDVVPGLAQGAGNAASWTRTAFAGR